MKKYTSRIDVEVFVEKEQNPQFRYSIQKPSAQEGVRGSLRTSIRRPDLGHGIRKTKV